MGKIYDRIIEVMHGRMEPEELGGLWRVDIGMPIYQLAQVWGESNEYQRARLAEQTSTRIIQLAKEEWARIQLIRSKTGGKKR